MPNTHSIDLELSSSQYLTISDGSQSGLDLSGDFTFEAYLNPEAIPSNHVILSKYDAGGGDRAYTCYISSTGKIVVNLSDDGSAGGGHYVQYTSSVTVSSGSFVHIAVSFDISTETCKMYKDGVEDTSVSQTYGSTIGASLHNSSAAFAIGAEYSNGSPRNYFDGLIDEVRVWSVVRTASEISNNKDTELTGSESNLEGYWKLNNSLLDETSNNNDLTNNNSAVFSTTVPFTGEESSFVPKVIMFRGYKLFTVKYLCSIIRSNNYIKEILS